MKTMQKVIEFQSDFFLWNDNNRLSPINFVRPITNGIVHVNEGHNAQA